MPVATSSTPGTHRIERRREGVGGADRGRADHHDTPAHRRAGVGVGVEDRLGAHRRDGAARTVEAQRQMVAEIDARPRLADADGVGFEFRLGPRRDRGRAQDEGRQEVGARRDQQRHVARRAGVIGRDVDEADRGRPGERRYRPEDALGNRQRRRAAAAEARLSESIGAREERRGADHRRPGAERRGELRVRLAGPALEEQHVERDRFRAVVGEPAHDPGEQGARQRVGAGAPHRLLVDGDDDDAVGRRPRPGDQEPPVLQRRLDAVEDRAASVQMPQAEEQPPGARRRDRRERDGGPPGAQPRDHQRPKRASIPAARSAPQVFTSRGCPGTTSTPWPAPSMTDGEGSRCRTATRPRATKTEVRPACTSTA